MSTIATIADAVAAHLNAGTFSQAVNAVRMYQPAFTLEDLAELRVSVVPRTTAIAAASRDSSTFECVVEVGVQKKLPADGADAEIDALLDLVEEITDHLRLKRLPGAPEAAWAGSVEVLGAPDLLSLLAHFKGQAILSPPVPGEVEAPARAADLAQVKGQETAKRALEIAAAGAHNLLFSGPPGSGKSLMAACMPGILPELTPAEALGIM